MYLSTDGSAVLNPMKKHLAWKRQLEKYSAALGLVKELKLSLALLLN